MSKPTLVLAALATAVSALGLLVACRSSPAIKDQGIKGELIIFNAGSLTAPLADLLREFVRRHPRVSPQAESSGSLDAVRKITELGKSCDLLAVADGELLPSLIVPQYADWYAIFARNQMVLMYTPNSKGAGEINGQNWFEVILRPGVQSGYSDPDADPAGYRTLLHWQLAENYYQKPGLYHQLKSRVPLKNIRPKSMELLALLESGELDYVYGYRSVAEQKKLPFINFPSEIDLSDIGKANYYETASVHVAGKKPSERLKVNGMPILYGLTILKSAPHGNLAELFVEFLISPDGQTIMKRNYVMAISPPLASPIEKLPGHLKAKLAPIEGEPMEKALKKP
ncbi:MAG: substrate-binding domain-containing protein [Acidobacteria bacterium]|nr:substrate-binding domain-containing protein [Acidobacteriota bacterium]MBI3656967.1 substrate-binding domain-containing protein [Acidobacteriota bacterium]